jgi:hypothetical protein
MLINKMCITFKSCKEAVVTVEVEGLAKWQEGVNICGPGLLAAKANFSG